MLSTAARSSRSSLRQRLLTVAACAALLVGGSSAADAQTTSTAPRAPTVHHRPPPKNFVFDETKPTCWDGDPAGPAILSALANGDAGFLSLAREQPEEAFRCSSLFPSETATAILREAALATPFDAIGAIEQLSLRPGGMTIIGRALTPTLLARSLDSGMIFYETRHELQKLMPPENLLALEMQARKALTVAFAKEPSAFSAKIGALLDDMTEESGRDRFRIVNGLPVEVLFELIARIGPQLYTSSFDGILDILTLKLKQERRTFFDLARDPAASALWGDFFIAVVTSGRGDTLFGPMAGNARDLARGSVRSLLAQETRIDAPIVAGALADAMDTKSDEIRAALEDELADHHRDARSPIVKATTGLAGGIHAGRMGTRPTTAAFAAERFADRYPPVPAPVLSEDRLFKNGVNVQRMTFYNDADGKSSFSGFIKSHRAAGWAIEEYLGFVVVSSPEKAGRRIVIVADTPDGGENGRMAVQLWLRHANLVPSVVVHRGHSYHEEETMPEISTNTAFVFWGSCGGQLRLRATLEQAPDALVLATQNIGTALVNQALLRTIEDRLLADGTINWTKVWADAQAKIRDRRFSAYSRPDQNSTLIALRGWRLQTEGKTKLLHAAKPDGSVPKAPTIAPVAASGPAPSPIAPTAWTAPPPPRLRVNTSTATLADSDRLAQIVR